MKITNLEIVAEAALAVMDINNPKAVSYIDEEDLVVLLTNAYELNDRSKEVTHRRKDTPTIIITQQAVSVILGDISTRYNSRQPLCLYEDLIDDLENILSSIDFCFIRLEERM